MAFRGDSTVLSVTEVLELIATNHLSGTLTIDGPTDRVRLYVRQGAIVCPAPPVRRSGVVSRDALAELLARGADVRAKRSSDAGPDDREGDGAPRRDLLASALERLRTLTPAARTECVQTAVCDALAWRRSSFEFSTAPVPELTEERLTTTGALRIDTSSVLLEAARRADETGGLKRDALGLGTSDDAERVVTGDVEGIALGALLQTIRTHRRTGSLSVTAATRTERLYFKAGQAYLFVAEDTSEDLLSGSWADGLNLNLVAHDRGNDVREAELPPPEAAALKEPFLDTLLWNGAQFRFELDSLPDRFDEPGPNDLRVELATDRFLVEAIQLLAAWERLRDVIGGAGAVWRFKDSASKAVGVRASDRTEVATLIDGQRSFEAIVHGVGDTHLEVGRVFEGLIEQDLLTRVEGR